MQMPAVPGRRRAHCQGGTHGQAMCSRNSILVGNTNRGNKMTPVTQSPTKRANWGVARLREGGVQGLRQHSARGAGSGRQSAAVLPAREPALRPVCRNKTPGPRSAGWPQSLHRRLGTRRLAPLRAGRELHFPACPRGSSSRPATEVAVERICVSSVEPVVPRSVVVSGDLELRLVSGFARRN